MNTIIDHYHDRTASWSKVKLQGWFAEGVGRIQFERFKIRKTQNNAEQSAKYKNQACDEQGSRDALQIR